MSIEMTIRELHLEISNLITPPEYVENDRPDGSGNDYPKPYYMRAVQLKYFPTSSWTITEKPIFNMNKLVSWVTTGRLDWDYTYIGHPEIKRSGMMAAAHQVQYLTDYNTGKKLDTLSDLGNDIKSSNTDTWKKALNFYQNICDDIYRWESPDLTVSQVTQMTELALQIPDKKRQEQILNTLKGGTFLLNKKNFNKHMDKLRKEIESSRTTIKSKE